LSMSGPASDRFIAGLGTRKPVFTGTQVIPRSVLLPPVPRQEGRDNDRLLRILFLGYLRANKNVDSLIGAFARAASGREELVIAGAGPELEYLRALAADRVDVTFAGHVDGEEKVALLCDADLLVVPSFIEPWGLVVNEALFYSLPVLASITVASSVLIEDGVDGMLFDPEQDGALEAQLRRYFSDPELRSQLASGAAAVDIGPVVDVDHGVAHIEKAIAQLAKGQNAA